MSNDLCILSPVRSPCPVRPWLWIPPGAAPIPVPAVPVPPRGKGWSKSRPLEGKGAGILGVCSCHRITEYPKWEGTHQDGQIPLLALPSSVTPWEQSHIFLANPSLEKERLTPSPLERRHWDFLPVFFSPLSH